MRNQTINNILSIQYCDDLVMINDYNSFTIKSLNNKKVGGVITLTNEQNETVTLSYVSELDYLVFPLMDSIRKLTNGKHATISVSGSVSNDGTSYPFTTFSFIVEQGRTLNSRPHGCTRTIYYNNDEDLSKIEIYVPTAASAIVGSTYLSLDKGVNKLDLSGRSGDFTIDISLSYSHSSQIVEWFDSFHSKSDDPMTNIEYKINVIQYVGGSDCSDGQFTKSGNMGKLTYTDIDGCDRHLFGKVTSIKKSSKQNEYRNNTLIMNEPLSLVGDCTEEITITFDDIDFFSYPTDIQLSTDVRYVNGGGVSVPCVLSTNSLEMTDGNYNDFKITIKTLA